MAPRSSVTRTKRGRSDTPHLGAAVSHIYLFRWGSLIKLGAVHRKDRAIKPVIPALASFFDEGRKIRFRAVRRQPTGCCRCSAPRSQHILLF
jgi:hypothetical protein